RGSGGGAVGGDPRLPTLRRAARRAARRRVRGDLPRLNQWATTAGPRRWPTGKHQVATQTVYGSSLVTVTLTSPPLRALSVPGSEPRAPGSAGRSAESWL